MPEIEMPEGHYFSLSGRIRPGRYGQTRALLMRNRMLALRCGIEPTLLTLDAEPEYPEVRAVLREQGLLVDPMRLVNAYEWYRDRGADHLPPTGDALADLSALPSTEELHPDGTVYCTVYEHPRGGVVRDYRRGDGSVYLRMNPAHGWSEVLRSPTSAPEQARARGSRVILVNGQGQPVGSWAAKGGWFRQWLQDLAPDGRRAFVVSDSRYALAHVVPIKDPRFHVMHLMHNGHTEGVRDWNSPMRPTYVPLTKLVRHLDGLVMLTHRHREDFGMRFGATTNLFVVPNPVESPPPPEHLPPRDVKRFAIVGRLEGQKRLDHAIRAFALVVAEEPDARLDIFGRGSLQDKLEARIRKLGLQDAVTLHGYDPRARETLWTATGFLMTSNNEGYPLATLESMSHGCPVISYDIKYGPREQITHGVDGFLVEPGDIRGVAERALELIRSPELVAKMSEAALEKALRHDDTAFLHDWRSVFESVVELKPLRTTLDFVTLKVRRLGHVGVRRVSDLPFVGRFAPALAGSGRIELDATLTVRGSSPKATLDSAVVTLEAVSDDSPVIVSIPLEVTRDGRAFRVSADFDPADSLAAFGGAVPSVRLRLRVVWQNSCWQTSLKQRLRPDRTFRVPVAG